MSKRGVVIQRTRDGLLKIHDHKTSEFAFSTPQCDADILRRELRDAEQGDRFLLVPLSQRCPFCGNVEHLTRDEVLADQHG